MTDLRDFKDKSQNQLIDYAVRMRKRAENAEADLETLRTALEFYASWENGGDAARVALAATPFPREGA